MNFCSHDQRQYFEVFAKRPDVHKLIVDAIAPEIFGHDLIKQSIACLLFGGSRKVVNTFNNKFRIQR